MPAGESTPRPAPEAELPQIPADSADNSDHGVSGNQDGSQSFSGAEANLGLVRPQSESKTPRPSFRDVLLPTPFQPVTDNVSFDVGSHPLPQPHFPGRRGARDTTPPAKPETAPQRRGTRLRTKLAALTLAIAGLAGGGYVVTQKNQSIGGPFGPTPAGEPTPGGTPTSSPPESQEPTGTPGPTETPGGGYSTPDPSETNEPTPSPSGTTEPSTSPSASATPSEVPTPTEAVYGSFLEIVKAHAEFPEGGELKAENGELNISFSQGVLDLGGIKKVSAPDKILNKLHDLYVNNAYDIVNKRVGTKLKLATIHQIGHEIGRSEPITGVVNKIKGFSLTHEEFDGLESDLKNTKFKYLTGYESPDLTEVDGFLSFDPDGSLIIVRRVGNSLYGGLYQIPPNWNRVDVSRRVAAAGPVPYFGMLSGSAQAGELRGHFRTAKPDPAYEALGCNSGNNYCATNQGSLAVEFN